jgi:hypothetical protein
MINITFYVNDNSGKRFNCTFRSWQSWLYFVEHFVNRGGYCRFLFDVNSQGGEYNNLEIIPATIKGFRRVYSALYD